MTERAPTSLVDAALLAWNGYSARVFLQHIGLGQLLPPEMQQQLRSQLDADRVFPSGESTEAPWVSIEQRLTLAAKRNDLEEVGLLLARLEETYQQVSSISGLDLPPLADLLLKPLTEAAGGGHLALTELLLNRLGGNYRPNMGHDPLAAAARGGHLEVMKLLLLLKCGDSLALALSVAASNGQWPAVELLLKHGRMAHLERALFEALRTNRPEIVHLLLERGATLGKGVHYSQYLPNNPAILDELLQRNAVDPQELLIVALATNQRDLASRLIEHHGANPEDPVTLSRAMEQVATNGNMAAFHDLLSRGATIPATMMEEAAGVGHLPLVQELIRHNANPGKALEYAAEHGHLAIVRELLTAPGLGDPTAALGDAAEHGHLAIVQELFSLAASSDDALVAAAVSGQLEVFEWLLANRHSDDDGDDDRDEVYDEALMEAAEGGHLPIVKQLARRLAVPQNLDIAVINAAQFGKMETIQWLLANGAKPSMEATQIAAEGGHLEVAQLLNSAVNSAKKKSHSGKKRGGR